MAVWTSHEDPRHSLLGDARAWHLGFGSLACKRCAFLIANSASPPPPGGGGGVLLLGKGLSRAPLDCGRLLFGVAQYGG
jgi:hypothetical protein